MTTKTPPGATASGDLNTPGGGDRARTSADGSTTTLGETSSDALPPGAPA